MSKALRAADYLRHILQAIERIERYTAHLDQAAFLGSELVQDAVIRNVEIVGEASNNIQRFAPAVVSQNKHIPWQVMYAMRNRLSHAYHKVDQEIVWTMVRNDLPRLHAQIEAALAALPATEDGFPLP